MPSPPVKLVVREQEHPGTDFDVATAKQKRPNEVRNALIDALCLFELDEKDIIRLRLYSTFRSGLQQSWSKLRHKSLEPVLTACCLGRYSEQIEGLFYNYGAEYGVIALYCAAKQERKIFNWIAKLGDEEEQIKFVQDVLEMPAPSRAAILTFGEDFKRNVLVGNGLPQESIPLLPRPRKRKRNTNVQANPPQDRPRQSQDNYPREQILLQSLPSLQDNSEAQNIASGSGSDSIPLMYSLDTEIGTQAQTRLQSQLYPQPNSHSSAQEATQHLEPQTQTRLQSQLYPQPNSHPSAQEATQQHLELQLQPQPDSQPNSHSSAQEATQQHLQLQPQPDSQPNPHSSAQEATQQHMQSQMLLQPHIPEVERFATLGYIDWGGVWDQDYQNYNCT